MNTLDRLLLTLRATTDDRVVIVSNYTQTLDLIEIICEMRHWPFTRLDGTTSGLVFFCSQRQQLATHSCVFVFVPRVGEQ
jgi:SNF2 family DNA or RNA helicase